MRSWPRSWLNRLKITSLILIKLIHSIIQNRIIQTLRPYRFFLIRTWPTINTCLIHTVSLIHTVLPNLILRVKSTVSTYLVHTISLMKTIRPIILQRIILTQSFRGYIVVPLLRSLSLIVILQQILIKHR